MPTLPQHHQPPHATSLCLARNQFSIQCPQCGRTIRPSKEPLPFWTCFSTGGLSAYLSFWFYIKYIEDNFLHAIGFGACMAAIAVIIIAIIVVRKIDFI